MAWNKLYKDEYLKSIQFSYDETIIYEDDESFPKLFAKARKVSHMDATLYAYHQRQG